MAQHRFRNIRHRRSRCLCLSRSTRLLPVFTTCSLVASSRGIMRCHLRLLFSLVCLLILLDTLPSATNAKDSLRKIPIGRGYLLASVLHVHRLTTLLLVTARHALRRTLNAFFFCFL